VTTPHRLTEADSGCYIDGQWGQYGPPRLIQWAVSEGFPAPPGLAAAAAAWLSEGSWDLSTDQVDQVLDAQDSALDWLTENLAPPHYSFGWYEGEVFLWPEALWITI